MVIYVKLVFFDDIKEGLKKGMKFMAKRRKSQQKATEELVGALVVGAAAGVYFLTHSFALTGIFLFSAFVILLIILFTMKTAREQKLKRSGILEIDRMDGVQFERYLASLFERLGYQTKTTAVTNDYGADLLLQNKKERIVVQAKRYNSKVGIKAVQEIASAKSYYSAHQAWVVTNSEYTIQAQKLAQSVNVKLIDRKGLIDLMLRAKNAS